MNDGKDDTGTYQAVDPTHGGYGMPRGPLGYEPRDTPRKAAIGFCPRCTTNARRTCSNRGAFECSTCGYAWYDERVGEQTYELEDFLSNA